MQKKLISVVNSKITSEKVEKTILKFFYTLIHSTYFLLKIVTNTSTKSL